MDGLGKVTVSLPPAALPIAFECTRSHIPWQLSVFLILLRAFNFVSLFYGM